MAPPRTAATLLEAQLPPDISGSATIEPNTVWYCEPPGPNEVPRSGPLVMVPPQLVTEVPTLYDARICGWPLVAV